MNLKNNIELFLIKHKMNASQLEREAKLAPSTIRKIILGVSKNPTLKTLLAICTTINCSLDELVGMNDK